ncbi:MAG TPA: hypothetical protein VFG86_07795, partial [Chloroflexota bacterium]|nr:hypothetical protein [Chloroflexota bacterium]
GLGLFWVSYLALPVAESYQAGGGFWRPMIDASGYYVMAARVADQQALASLDGSVPSPFFVDALGIWMLGVGISPAAAMFLNLCVYVAVACVIVKCFAPVDDWRRDLPCIVGVGGYSFAPAILIHSTQPLKDELSAGLVVMACVGVLGLSEFMRTRTASRSSRLAALAGSAAVIAATFSLAGIRWYFAALIWCALLVTLAGFAVRGRRTPLPAYLVGSAVVLLTAWLAFYAGAGPYASQIAAAPTRLADVPFALANVTQLARYSFLASGGNTNIVVPLRDDPMPGATYAEQLAAEQRARISDEHRAAANGNEGNEAIARRALEDRALAARMAGIRPPNGPGHTPDSSLLPPPRHPDDVAAAHRQAARAIPVFLVEYLRTLVTGLALVFVPVSLVEAVSSIDLPGSRELQLVSDVDTLFLDAAVVCMAALLWRRRHAVGDRLPLVVFALLVSGATAALLGYVVSNFGTLWRMRPMFAVPLFILAVTLPPRRDAAGAEP